ncbi:MAG TPA: hypothetical protein DHV26_03625 [Cytophagales bacterium]|nr:hypothetical protein [Flavobacterium sp.]HCZ34996.1 hypothetical protein [Cytophagales bacterium]
MNKLITVLSLLIISCNSGNDVYICKGPQSKAYHNNSGCKGLKRCSTDIESVTEVYATKQLNRHKCRFCY